MQRIPLRRIGVSVSSPTRFRVVSRKKRGALFSALDELPRSQNCVMRLETRLESQGDFVDTRLQIAREIEQDLSSWPLWRCLDVDVRSLDRGNKTGIRIIRDGG